MEPLSNFAGEGIRHARIGRATGHVEAWDPAQHDGVVEPADSMRERLAREWPDVVRLGGGQVVGELHFGPVLEERGRRFMRCWAYATEKDVPEDVVAKLTDEDFRSMAGWIAWRE
jgi:hypothetical protein